MNAMKIPFLVGSVCLAALAGCGLEGLFANATHHPFDRPASKISGTFAFGGAPALQLGAIDGSGNALAPFETKQSGSGYELRLPSAAYTMIEAQARAGDVALRAIVPELGPESGTVANLDARSTTETLISEARLSADGMRLAQVTPAAYLGTRALIQRDLDDATTPAYQLLQMVQRLLDAADKTTAAPDPDMFRQPVLTSAFAVTTSPITSGWLARNPLDYDGDGIVEHDSTDFDAMLAQVAQLYRPAGCPDPTKIRVMFTVDFNEGALNGNGGTVNRFKWATDKPGKSMFFVGWIYTRTGMASEVQDPDIQKALGNGVPNTIPMHDDGTGGDEVAGDGIWTVYFDLPFDPTKELRIGYKYTWGFQGAPWTGSEEWPGNSRIIQIDDIGPPGGDGIVYRRDVFGDEATNKDQSNLNFNSTGSITFDTDLRGCGIPEAREQPFVDHNAMLCGTTWHTPTSVGRITKVCE